MERESLIKSVEMNGQSMDVTVAGRVYEVPYHLWPKLAEASDEERRDVRISNLGLHWKTLDYDISIDGITQGYSAA